MKRCFELALIGKGKVAPNPLVGCVIVYQNKIIGEGYHQKFGQAHAEVNAIHSVKDKSVLKDSDIYVSLEPCSHFGKTPPCANLIIKHQFKKVIVACLDPNPLVSGKGISLIKQAGIEVETLVLEQEAIELNKAFFTQQIHKRPFVILKWAESKDGFLGNEKHKKISQNNAQTLLHQWRTEEQAFLVGTNTLIQDNPKLDSRILKGKNPIRIAIDMNLKSKNLDLNYFDQSQKTIILNQDINEQNGVIQWVKIKDSNAKTILEKLSEMGIQSVVIEGGAAILNHFIAEDLFDEIRIFQSKKLLLNHGIKAPIIENYEFEKLDLGEDVLKIYKKENLTLFRNVL